MDIQVTEILVGITAGFMSSVFGLGGGIIIVPALNVYLQFNQHEAVATSLFSIGLITLINTIRFNIQRSFQWKVTLQLTFLGAVSAFIAGKLAVYFSAEFLTLLFILVLAFLIWRLHRTRNHQKPEKKVLPPTGKLAKMGLFAGFVSGFCGVGGGSVLGPLLLDCKRIHHSDVVPVTNVFMMVSAFSAAAAYAFSGAILLESWQIGQIHLDSACFIFLGAIPSAILGTKIQGSVSFKLRKIFLFIFLGLILIRMLVRFFWHI